QDGRIVTLGQLIFFSTETGDAWLLDWEDGLAARLAWDGDPEPIHIEETEANFSIEERHSSSSIARQVELVGKILAASIGALMMPACWRAKLSPKGGGRVLLRGS